MLLPAANLILSPEIHGNVVSAQSPQTLSRTSLSTGMSPLHKEAGSARVSSPLLYHSFCSGPGGCTWF